MELNQLWQSVLGEIELQLPRAAFITWIKNSQLVDDKDGVALVALPNAFAKDWVQNKYQKTLLGALRSKNDRIKAMNFVINTQTAVPNSIKPLKQDVKLVDTNQLAFDEFKIDSATNLNPKYTLKSFIVGKTNELAYAAGLAVVDSLGNKYNPLFIWGGVGLGKTHLIQAIGNEIKEKYQNKVRVRYVTSEKFTNDVIASIQNKRTEDMKDKYRNTDVLIIDDIQFLAGKQATQEEFFHTFNALHQSNKQIIISADRSPQNMPVLEDRLRSRLSGGMAADISSPDYELRLAVLRTKLQESNINFPDEITDFIASKIQRSIRDLEGILNRIIFYKNAKKGEVTKEVIENIINETVGQSLKNVNPDTIIKTVADHFQIPVSELTSKSRKQEVIEPRQIAIYLLREVLDLSYPCIGDKLGKRDHTTAIYAYNKIVDALTKNSALNQKILLIKDQIIK